MAGIRMENKIYEVGMYCRLSKDDGTDNESASIATQKSILTDYVKKQGWHLAKTYVDDGYSGTNFQRPSFQNMIKDIESGLINCVITKDLSRLGRNYLDCGLYLEVFFPEHNVRYIAVNDGVDTLNKSAMDITPFRNILNEMYSADVSVKIKSAYRARFQQGKFMGTTAPYGYVKDPADHNHLLIDDKVAHVVREIFDLALAGNGIAKIRKHINKQHILRPAAYAAEQGATGYERYFEENEENRYIWSENSVRGILRSPIYAGNLAGYKRIAANMKSKKRPSKLPEEWEVIPDTHEGIVTQEEFDTVQQLITSRRLPENKGGFENIFAGVIKCADCGYAMRAMSANRRKRPDIIDCVQYSCNNYGRYGNIMCTAHSIEARDLFNAVLTDINRFADMAVNDEKAVRAIEKRLTETDQSKAKALEKEQRKLNKRLAELDRLFSSLYEDKVMERITERNFEMMSGKYQKEQLEIEARLKEVTETLSDSYEKTQGVRDFLSLIRNYQGIKELDATIINALIDKILVSEREKLTDGMVRQEIKIYYKFIGFVGELHITPTKRWTALKPKNCTVCGVEYVPRSGISKYCPACAKKIQREKSNESKRRSRERNRQACIELSAKNDRLIWNSRRDVPWRPSDIEQQEGRILRQGNLNPKVKIFRYVTEGTFDSYSWQLIENKQKFIGQIMTSKSPVRSCEDVDEAALTYAEVKALATGNPYIKEKMDLDIQVSKLKLMKANHTSQKYRLEDNIAKHYPQQITILKERISGMQADIQTAKANLPVDKEQFSMKIGDTLYTDKKEAGTALVEMCKEIKTVNAPAVIGEYAGFKMAVSFDAFNHKFVMNLKGQLSHNLEVGSDPLGNISRINHALESMPKQLMEAQTKLETVEHQFETAKVEVTKPFEQEAELAEKLERLSALNALLNMDEKGNDGIDMDDEPEAPKSEKEVADRPAKNTPLAEKTVGIGQDKSIRQYADVPAERVSLKAKLEVMKAKVAGGDTEKPMPQKVKGKEETL